MRQQSEDDSGLSMGATLGVFVGAVIVLALLAAVTFRVAFVDHVDSYELGYKFDSMTGEITVIPHAGYVVTPPFIVKVHTVDLRPMQVCINANARVLNCKLVKFDPTGLGLFVSWHGRNDYNQVLLNQILMSYAYDGTGTTYPFLTILRELKTDTGPTSTGTTGATGPSTAVDTSVPSADPQRTDDGTSPSGE